MRQLSFPLLQQRSERSVRAAAGRDPATGVRQRVIDVGPRPRRARHPSLRRRLPRWLERLLRPTMAAAALGAAIVLLFAGIVTIHLGGIAGTAAAVRSAIVAWTGTLGIAVQEVLVEGRRETSPDAVLAALDVDRGTPLLAFSPEAARRRLLALGWVKEARIERRLPGTIYVDLEERHPAAIWQRHGEYTLVDASGAVIGSDALARYHGLRVIVGDRAPARFAELFALLDAEADLARRVVAAVRVGDRRWNVQLDNGMTVLLPETGVADAWALLARLADERALLERGIAHIDLRNPDRLTVRLAPVAAPRPADRGA